jgi:hypothetical protein
MTASRNRTNAPGPRARAFRLAAFDDALRAERDAAHARDAAKIARLRALRLAQPPEEPASAGTPPPARKRLGLPGMKRSAPAALPTREDDTL